jgi:hypothetical protein
VYCRSFFMVSHTKAFHNPYAEIFSIHYFSCSENGKDKANIDAPENNTQYRTVYVGNLAHEVVSSSILLSIHLLLPFTCLDHIHYNSAVTRITLHVA